MRPDIALRRALVRAAAATAILLGLLLSHAPYLGLALRLWLVVLAGIFTWALAGRVLRPWEIGDGPPRRVDWRWWRRPGRREPPRGLEELEHAVDFSLATAFDLHYRLRPHLVRLAGHSLARHGISLEADPEPARRLLGEEGWDVIRPDRAAPGRRDAPGVDLVTLRRIVERLDAL